MAGASNSNPGFVTSANGMHPNGGQSSSGANSANDYSGWTWKQIEAAIDGGSEMVGSAAVTQAVLYSNPQSLWEAANTFEFVRKTLQMISDALANQAQALAGGTDSPWQGAAAEAFLDSVNLFSAQVGANAAVLSGGSAGDDNVPNQLLAAGNRLNQAQATVNAIDNWYADQAIALGAPVMSNNLVQVSAIPQIPPMMTADMLKYAMMPLANQYVVTIDTLKPPNPADYGVGNPNGLGNSSYNIHIPKINYSGGGNGNSSINIHVPHFHYSPNSGANSPSNYNIHVPGFHFTSPNSGANSPGNYNIHVPAFHFTSPNTGANSPSNINVHVPGFHSPNSPAGGVKTFAAPNSQLGLNSPTGLGANSPLGARAVVTPFNGRSVASPNAGLGGNSRLGLNSPAGAVSPFGQKAAVSPFNGGRSVASGPGAGLGGNSRLGLNSPVGAVAPFTGAKAVASPNAFQPSRSAPGAVAPLKGLSNSRSPLGGRGTANSPINAFNPVMDQALNPSQLTSPAGLATSTNAPAVMPFMPGAGAVGAGTGAGAGNEPTDASGLLSAKPFSDSGVPGAQKDVLNPGAVPGTGSLNGLSPAAFTPNATSTAGPAVMPFMPGAGAAGAGAGAGAGNEPTDASGLLSAKPFSDSGVPGAEKDVVNPGAVPGEGSLNGLSPAAFTPNAASTAGPAVMPFMPGAGAAGAGAGAGTGNEPTDASGLLGGQAEPWTGDEAVPGLEKGVVTPGAGAVPGTGSLNGLGADNVPGESLAAEGEPGDVMPFLPGSGVGAGGAGAGAGNEPTDASGLLGGQAEPWTGDEAVPGLEKGVVTPGAGAVPGAASLNGLGAEDLPGEESGIPAEDMAMPFLPGAGAAGAGAGAGTGNEPTDASGLLGGHAEPWNGDEATPDLAAGLLGTAAGGALLSGLGAARGLAGARNGDGQPPAEAPGTGTSPDETPAEGADAAADDVPFFPGGAAGAGNGRRDDEETSDASGLLGGELPAWFDPEGGAETDPAAGAPAGGAGLYDETADDETADGKPSSGAHLGDGAPAKPAAAGLAGAAEAAGMLATGAAASELARDIGSAANRGREEEKHRDRTVADHPGPDSPAADEELAAWDAGAAGAWFLTGRRKRDDEREEKPGPGYATEEDAWHDDPADPDDDQDPDGSGLARWRRVPPDPSAVGPEVPEANIGRRRSSDAPYVPPEEPEPEDEPEEDEDEESSAGDLLIEESSLWGSPVDGLDTLG